MAQAGWKTSAKWERKLRRVVWKTLTILYFTRNSAGGKYVDKHLRAVLLRFFRNPDRGRAHSKAKNGRSSVVWWQVSKRERKDGQAPD